MQSRWWGILGVAVERLVSQGVLRDAGGELWVSACAETPRYRVIVATKPVFRFGSEVFYQIGSWALLVGLVTAALSWHMQKLCVCSLVYGSTAACCIANTEDHMRDKLSSV